MGKDTRHVGFDVDTARYRRLVAKGKLRQKVTTAIGRELLGFIWAIGVQVEKEQQATGNRRRAA